MNDTIEFGTKLKAAMAAAKLEGAGMSGFAGQVALGRSFLQFTDPETRDSAVELLSPAGIDDDLEEPIEWVDAAADLIVLAHLKVEEAIVALDEAEDALRCANLPGRSLMVRNAWRHLESYQSRVLVKKLGAKVVS